MVTARTGLRVGLLLGAVLVLAGCAPFGPGPTTPTPSTATQAVLPSPSTPTTSTNPSVSATTENNAWPDPAGMNSWADMTASAVWQPYWATMACDQPTQLTIDHIPDNVMSGEAGPVTTGPYVQVLIGDSFYYPGEQWFIVLDTTTVDVPRPQAQLWLTNSPSPVKNPDKDGQWIVLRTPNHRPVTLGSTEYWEMRSAWDWTASAWPPEARVRGAAAMLMAANCQPG